MRAIRLPVCVVVCLLALAAAAPSSADRGLRLDDRAISFDAWSAVRVLADPGGAMTLDDVRARAAAFSVPTVPTNNFGPTTGALWMHVPFDVRTEAYAWVLDIDYPPLNLIDVYILRDGRTFDHAVMGNRVPVTRRPLRSRGHAMPLVIAPGTYDLYLRVETTSAMVVPIRFERAESYLHSESGRLLLQGLLFGVTLMLLITSLVNGFSLRDPVFGWYALMMIGVSTFFVSFSGLGHQFLWSSQTGLLEKVSPWGALIATAGAAWFVSGALDVGRSSPGTARLLGIVAASGVVAFCASLVGLLDYRQTQLAPTVLGPLAIVIALSASLGRAVRGDRVAVYMTLGWGAYTVGAASMAAVLRGWMPVNFWSQHLFQFASIVEMIAWMRVLSLRIEAVRRSAERTAAETHALRSLAHTDPLTGIPNRRGLASALDAAVAAASDESGIAIFVLDLDGFKQVNDTHGHDAGDEVLVQVARRLREELRRIDLIARIGGDEFVVVATGVGDEHTAMQLGAKMVGACERPFLVGDRLCRVGLTAGVALAPRDGRDVAVLLRRADAAMYAGKQAGRHCVHRWQVGDEIAAAV